MSFDLARADRLLASRGWLAEQPESLRRRIVAAGRLIERRPGESVYVMGDAADGLYALLSGRMKFVNYTAAGREVGAWVTEPVDWFGEMSLFDGLPRRQTTVALDRSVVLHLPLSGFNAIIEAEPHYWRNFGMILSQHLRTALHYLEEVAAEPSHIRIGRLLLMMARGESERDPLPGAVVEISQEDLATTTGMSRQSANKALKRLEEAGLIERRYGAVILTHPTGLANVGR